MPRVSVITDNFNRANEDPLASPWSGSYTGARDFELLTNKIRVTDTSGNRGIMVVTTALDANQYSKAKLHVFEAGGDFFGVVARFANTPTQSGYAFLAGAGAITTRLYRIDSETLVLLDSMANPGWAVNDTCEIECEGTTIRGMRNGSTLLTATDATYAGGRAGILLWNPGGVADNMEADDFEAGNITAAAAADVVRRSLMGPVGGLARLLRRF